MLQCKIPQTYFKPGDNIPLWEFSEHQAEVGIYQVVNLLGAVDSRDVAQLRIGRCVEADEPRDDTTLSGQYFGSSAAAGRLQVMAESGTWTIK